MSKKADSKSRSYLVVVRRAAGMRAIQREMGSMSMAADPEVRWVNGISAEEAASQVKLERGDNALVVDREHVMMFRPPAAAPLEMVEGDELRKPRKGPLSVPSADPIPCVQLRGRSASIAGRDRRALLPHPHGQACRCPTPGPDGGLLAYTVDCDHYTQLAAALARVATLRVTTFDPAPPANLVALPTVKPCDGSMTCCCERCGRERAQRVRNGVHQARQPWEPLRRRAA